MDMATEIETILKLTVPVIVTIGQRKLSLEGVLALGPGAIVELAKSAEQPLDLLVNNKPVGQGAAVKVSENFGIRIDSIVTQSQRVEALGS